MSPPLMRFFTPPPESTHTHTPPSPVPAFVRVADEQALDGVTDDEIVKWCCYRDDEFMDAEDEDDDE
ncbi:hypothetical protein CcaverHIS002_0311860 [Cutaneotrichosporon cavernicola]|uniref:Uncharacterized protein n=1 Tax=Cutaneotrichosporon cavernicola TaxID=279322 RepID=A0AA48L365_9TREE|nr:uncharacterized protein CcaverHIS019_0311730 [Cutaneotrichosporon cavernicola]BEI83318.1 hypothetical protein CcaverHIS002_0311860 [Cutaneotrichosporon cavernicola]BEI91103.1 hypothetical protein CcaverHIS019_0311730 [Cutaneotrichosporon cavernicola]BEI98880.1 hypothetical protein CcaverHIS631_0311790 [Cutaneotrichosporon cavernicola]BEJ06653.1 hypothetical protein CcaverHIS641_0311750 [Cutaneotrichosporon cavernicola]